MESSKRSLSRFRMRREWPLCHHAALTTPKHPLKPPKPKLTRNEAEVKGTKDRSGFREVRNDRQAVLNSSWIIWRATHVRFFSFIRAGEDRAKLRVGAEHGSAKS